jgi:hypothetical protein
VEKEKLKALAQQVVEAVKLHVTSRLSPVETTLTQLEIRLAALEAKLAQREDPSRPEPIEVEPQLTDLFAPGGPLHEADVDRPRVAKAILGRDE